MNKLISQSIKQLSEFQMAENYASKGLHQEAHQLYLQSIKIIGNYENPRDLYQIAYKNSQFLIHQQQNEILSFGRQFPQTNLQYIKNLLYFNPQNALEELKKLTPSDLYYELLLVFMVSNSATETKQVILDMSNNVEDQNQCIQFQNIKPDRYKYINCLGELLDSQFSPIYLNNPLPKNQSLKIFEQFQNLLLNLNGMPFKFADKFLKSFSDFIVNDNIQNTDKSVVGQVVKQYLQFMEVHKPEFIYKPLFLLGWLNLRENKRLAAEGLFRNIDEITQKLPSYEAQLVRAQMSVQYIDLLKQFEKRQTEQQNLNNYLSSLKIPKNVQLMSLYLDYYDYEVQF